MDIAETDAGWLDVFRVIMVMSPEPISGLAIWKPVDRGEGVPRIVHLKHIEMVGRINLCRNLPRAAIIPSGSLCPTGSTSTLGCKPSHAAQ